jgi:hypothetical protein
VAGCFCTELIFWKIPQIFLIQKNPAANVRNPIDSADFYGVVLFLLGLPAICMLVWGGGRLKMALAAVRGGSAGRLDTGT